MLGSAWQVFLFLSQVRCCFYALEVWRCCGGDHLLLATYVRDNKSATRDTGQLTTLSRNVKALHAGC